MVSAKEWGNTAARQPQEMEAEMATMIAIGGIAVILQILSGRSGSSVLPGKNRMAVIRPRRAESEDGQHQPERKEAFEHAYGTFSQD